MYIADALSASLNLSERFEKQRAIVRMLCFETKNLERLMDYTVMSLTNPHNLIFRTSLTTGDDKCRGNKSWADFGIFETQMKFNEIA